MADQSDVTIWLTRIRAEYRDMPGLRLTERQMQRLWGLDNVTCAAVVDALITLRVLMKTPQDTYVRTQSGT